MSAPGASAPRSVRELSRFACWSEDLSEDGEVKIVQAHGHENAAACYMMQECAGISSHDNPPSAETILVVHLETGESRFVMMRLIVHVVENYASAHEVTKPASCQHCAALKRRGAAVCTCGAILSTELGQ